MATIEFITSKTMRVYKDGAYQGTLTSLSNTSTHNTIDKGYIGSEELVTIGGLKVFEGSLTRDMTDESWIEALSGNVVTTKVSTGFYTDAPDTVYGTVDNATVYDVSFTTPNKTGLIIDKLTFNALKVGDFVNGLDIQVWQGVAGVGTLKMTFHLDQGYLPTVENAFVDATKDPESAEVALVANTAHQLRFKKTSGSPTGSIDLYGASTDTEVYYAINYEMSNAEVADYFIDTIFATNDGVPYMTFRDTGVTFLSDGVTINPNEPLSEVTSYKASNRTII